MAGIVSEVEDTFESKHWVVCESMLQLETRLQGLYYTTLNYYTTPNHISPSKPILRNDHCLTHIRNNRIIRLQ